MFEFENAFLEQFQTRHESTTLMTATGVGRILTDVPYQNFFVDIFTTRE